MAYADLEIRFLVVGEADSAILVCDGEAMIIDGGYHLIKSVLGGSDVYDENGQQVGYSLPTYTACDDMH